jgi:hypothetical protein
MYNFIFSTSSDSLIIIVNEILHSATMFFHILQNRYLNKS